MKLSMIFQQAREDCGGSNETELQRRYSDRRLWNAYKLRWKPMLSSELHLGNASFSGTLTGNAGEYQAPFGAGDRKITLVLLAQPSGNPIPLPQTSRASLLRDGLNLLSTGVPSVCYIEAINGVANLCLYPVPDAAWSAHIFGDGSTGDEIDESTAFQTSGMFVTSAVSPAIPPRDIEAAHPEHVHPACIAFLAWRIAATNAATMGTALAESLRQESVRQFRDCLAKFNLALEDLEI